MSDATISTAKVSVGADVEPAGSGDSVTAAEAIVHEVKVANPLKVPYRTGSYLIYDEGGTDHFRSANALTEHPYRASGSHQLDFDDFVSVLGKVVQQYAPSTIYLVDLREETHGFFDLFDGTKRFGVAVSWYADNDFGNVGQPLRWIMKDEAIRLAMIEEETTQVFAIEEDLDDNRDQQRMAPRSYQEVAVSKAETEARVAARLEAKVGCPVALWPTRSPLTTGFTSTATVATDARRRSLPCTTCGAGRKQITPVTFPSRGLHVASTN